MTTDLVAGAQLAPASPRPQRLPSLRGQLSLVLGGLALGILVLVGGYLGKLAVDELRITQQAAVQASARLSPSC